MPYIVDTSLTAKYCPLIAQEPSEARVSQTRPDTDSLYGGKTMPRRIVQKSVHKELPDFMINADSWIVSQAFKDIVEHLGCGRNKFLPIRVVRKDGTASLQKYYYLDVYEKRQAVNFEQSRGDFVEMHGVRVFVPKLPLDYVIDLDLVKDVHIWREPEEIRRQIFFSDELVASVEKAKLKKLDYTKLRVSET